MEQEIKELSTPTLLDFASEIAMHDSRIERCRIHEGRTIAFSFTEGTHARGTKINLFILYSARLIVPLQAEN